MVWLGWCPCLEIASIVIISTVAININNDKLVNIFIVCLGLFTFLVGVLSHKTIGTTRSQDAFLFFVFSFGENEVVYINNVIIPDENVRITTNATHLVIVVLNRVIVLTTEITSTEIAISIGFSIFKVNNDIIDIVMAIFLLPFDLQNQCSFELFGIFFSYFVFFFCLFLILIYRRHYVFLLLLIELFLLGLFIYMCWFFFLSFGIMGLFIFLLVIVCMGGFSISLLVSLARGIGRDFWFSSFIF